MPTGYTSTLHDGEQSFADFLMGCARAFGACISLRDEPNSTPIPETFEPSTWSKDRLVEAKADLELWSNLTDTEVDVRAAADYEAQDDRWVARLRENKRREDRYNAMLVQVANWNPPTPGHQEFKNFMLNQIQISMDDCNTYGGVDRRDFHPEAYRAKKIAQAKRDIEYHTKKWAEECKRTADRTAWVTALRDSIGGAQ